jgi:glutamate synthase domain-containing protein 1
MCGVIGLLIKDPVLETELGRMLVPMVNALAERGPDSSGIAVYSRPAAEQRPDLGGPPIMQVSLGSDGSVPWDDLATWVSSRFSGASVHVSVSGMRVDVAATMVDELTESLGERWPSVYVFGTGQMLTVVKDTGRPEDTCRRYGVASWTGHLAVAHTRMATESAVTARHSHPFVPGPDLCVVHNGSFSNHASVRRHLERDGVRFDSDNDSEVAARLLAQRLMGGDDLDEATRWVMKEMDGFFTLVVGTATAMSVVRDAFACKPAVVAVSDAYVAVASEYRALAGLPEIDRAHVFEPQPEVVYTWTL